MELRGMLFWHPSSAAPNILSAYMCLGSGPTRFSVEIWSVEKYVETAGYTLRRPGSSLVLVSDHGVPDGLSTRRLAHKLLCLHVPCAKNTAGSIIWCLRTGSWWLHNWKYLALSRVLSVQQVGRTKICCSIFTQSIHLHYTNTNYWINKRWFCTEWIVYKDIGTILNTSLFKTEKQLNHNLGT